MNSSASPIEVHKMLALSTAHVKPETIALLADGEVPGALYFPKGIWGFFVYVPSAADGIEIDPSVPADLHDCMAAARQLGHGWLMLDQDVQAIDSLPVYEHDGDDSNAPITAMTEEQISMRNIADAYARHLTVKHNSVYKAQLTASGKIAVREARPDGAYLVVSVDFASAMLADALVAVPLEPSEVLA